MHNLGTGAGLAALGFWSFIAAVVAVGVWDSIRKRVAHHETLRRIIESGQPIDDSLADQVLKLTGSSKDLERDLKVSGLITLFVAPGLIALGWILSSISDEIFHVMLGVSILVGSIAIGLLIASYVVGRWYSDNGDTKNGQPGT